MRYVAPSGAPIGPGDLARWLGVRARSVDARADLARVLAGRYQVTAAVPMSTGRAAMVVALQALRDLADPRRTDVVIPSYTCYSVAASVAKAGLTIRVADIRPATLDFEDALTHMDHSRTLAVIATNLFGFPSDFVRLRAIAAQSGVALVDDAAQALGAESGGEAVGTRGDIGILSFDKGKNVSAMACGAILCRDSTADAVLRRVSLLAAPRIDEEIALVLKALVYTLLLPPSMYWIPNSLPWLGLGQTRYTLDYPLELSTSNAASLVTTMLRRAPAFTERRRANAAALAAALRGVPGVTPVAEQAGTRAAYLRLPLLVDQALRPRLVAALTAAGIGATTSYPTAIPDIPDLREALAGVVATGGREVAARIITLPTHPFVTIRDIETMAATIIRVTGGRDREAAAGEPSRSIA